LDDLKLKGTIWFYHHETGQRCLLARFAPSKNIRKVLIKTIRGLAKQVTVSLKDYKIEKADFVMQFSRVDIELLGEFENSFAENNYEQNHKIAEA